MKILVTGSHGFLGSHLVRRLKSDGHNVVGWDIFDGNDVCDKRLKSKNIDAIFHFACPVDPNDYKSVAVPTMLASSIGTYNMLELAKKNKAKFLYVSSSEVYGESLNIPFKEIDPGVINTVNYRAYYGESKRFGEMQTMVYHHYFHIDTRILRPFNIYGSGMKENDNRVIPSFFRSKKAGISLIVNDSGKSTRTFCYVDDFIEGTIKSMFYDNTNGEIFNLGTNDPISILDLAKMISDNIQIKEDTRLGEQRHRIPDISKAYEILKWQPKISLKKGLEEMWKSYQ